MNTQPPYSFRVVLTLLCGMAMLLLAAPARAQITLVDNELNTNSPINSASTYLLLNTNLTVSASANTLVVIMTFRNNDTTFTECPATLGWTNGVASPQTLTLVNQAVDKNSHGRGVGIYYLYNPTAGTGFNINGHLSGQTPAGSSGTMVAYTLGGVDTSVVPPLSCTNASTVLSIVSQTLGGVTGNSWAAVGGSTAVSVSLPISVTNSGVACGTPVLVTTATGFSSTSTSVEGYISSILLGGTETFTIATVPNTASDISLEAVVFKPLTTTYLGIASQPGSVTIPSGMSLNATFSVVAGGNPAISSYQWYEIGGGATNAVAGATSASYTTNAPTLNGTSYYVVVGNGSVTVTSTVAALNIYTPGTWATASGSWNTPSDWVGNATASGVDATASFVNLQGGTVTLDNTPGWTVGTNIFGTTGQTSPQTPWIIAAGSPAGTLTMALDGALPTSVVSGNANPTVTEVPVITVFSNNPVTITAPVAGKQGLFINGGGTLILAGNNTFTGPTVVGGNTSDLTSLQIGTGGTSGAIDFTQPILYLSGSGQLIFNRSDTITLQSALNDQDGKTPNLIVNSGTVIWAPTVESQPYDGAIVNSGGTLVLDCPAAIFAIANGAGTVQITNGLPATPYDGDANGGNAQNVSLGISSGGTVRLAGPGGIGVNIKNDGEGALDNGTFDLGGDVIQIGFIAGAGVVTNSGATLATLNLLGSPFNAAYPWNGTIKDGTLAQTAVTLSGGTTVFNGVNTYTGPTLIMGTLELTNSASLASANIIVGSGKSLNLVGLSGNFTLNAGQTLIVTNTGAVSGGANTVIAAPQSTLLPGGYGVAGTMNVNANLTLNGNTNVFDLAMSPAEGGGVNDEIVGVTNLTLTGNITIVVNTNFNNTFSPSTSYKLIKYSGTLANSATFTVVPSTLGGGSVTIDTVDQPGYVLLVTGGSSPPTLATTITNLDAFTGYPVTLTAVESGSLPMTNQWYIGATAIGGANSSTYTFTPLTAGVYTYTLDATNAYGHASKTFNVSVASPTISIQCALTTAQYAGALYLAPSNTAGEFAVSNWNVIAILPQNNVTSLGITSSSLVDTNGFVTPATFTAVNVQDGWHSSSTITTNDTGSAQMMATYWYANPIGGHTPATNNIQFTFTNLPNDTYNVYVYLLQSVSSGTGGPVEVYDSTSPTNYLEYSEYFSSQSNFVTAFDYTGSLPYPYGNYAHLVISTGGSNSISFTESGTVAGVGGAGVCGVQITPELPVAPAIVQQPANERVVTNTTGTFSVQATGYPLYYQWYVISPAGVTNAIGGATGSSYTTAPVVDANTGTGYFVIVSNVLSHVSSSTAYLTVGHMVTASLVIDNQFYDDGVPGIGTIFNTIPGLFPNSMVLSSPNTWSTEFSPVHVEYLTAFQSPVNDLAVEPPPFQPEAEQIYGWFTPTVSGDYVFFMTTDDEGMLWLSTNSSPTNSYQIAQNEAGMVELDWLCANTGSPEYTTTDYTYGEFRSDQFIGNSGNQSPYSEYTCPSGWVPTPNFNATDGGIALVAGTPYYIELDNAYGGGAGDNQSAAVTCKLAGQPDPVGGSASLLTGNNISSSVPDSALPPTTPVITSIALTSAGTKVILQATNGVLNARCNLLWSTNLTQAWNTSAAGTFNLGGGISITNTVVPSTQATFYQLQMFP